MFESPLAVDTYESLFFDCTGGAIGLIIYIGDLANLD